MGTYLGGSSSSSKKGNEGTGSKRRAEGSSLAVDVHGLTLLSSIDDEDEDGVEI